MRKTVRTLGVLGIAPTALAFATANAQATLAAKPATTGKSVQATHKAPQVNCGNKHSAYDATVKSNELFSATIYYSGQCVYLIDAWLHLKQFRTGLVMRTRFWSGGGGLERSQFVGGGEYGASIEYNFVPDTYAHQVCEAIVPNNNHGDVLWGPICEYTS